MEIGNKINQLRKLSGMTQEQLAEKLNISRQTLSKWESGATSPDLSSIVTISKLYHVSLDELLMEETEHTTHTSDEQITLSDLVNINLHQRRMMMLLASGLSFIMVSLLNFAYVTALRNVTSSTQYMLYRYFAVGQFESAPIDYTGLMIPSAITGVIGLLLCFCYLKMNWKKGDKRILTGVACHFPGV
jgi:transcriptional regulator with XRE-family HTH domain